MNMKTVQIHMIILSCVLCFIANAERQFLYERINTPGSLCQSIDMLFSVDNPVGKTTCCIECAKYSNCLTVAYDQQTGTCTGCSVDYDSDMSFVPPEDMLFYKRKKCPVGWFNFQDSCYFITEEMTYEAGVNECLLMGAGPIALETKEEIAFIESQLAQLQGIEYFIGYTDAQNEGTWLEYGSTREPSIMNWGIFEPNGFIVENCVAFNKFQNFRWFDLPCTRSCSMICEKGTIG